MALKAKPFLPLVAEESYLTASGQVVCLEQSADQTLVYHRLNEPGHLVYWVKKTGRLFRNNEDSPLGNIIGLANDPLSLEYMLKECLE